MAWFKKQNTVVKIIVGVIALGFTCCVCSIPMAIISPDSNRSAEKVTSVEETKSGQPVENTDSTESPTQTEPTQSVEVVPTEAPVQPTQTPPPTVAPTPDIKALSFSEVVRNPEDAGWTEVRFDEYKESIKGLRAENWQGNIGDVKESMLGDYYLEVDMPGTEDSVDVFLYVEKEIALSLGKGKPVTFSGTIDGLYPNLFGDWSVEVKDGTISNIAEISTPADNSTQPPAAGNVIDFYEITRNPDNAGWTDIQFDEYKTSIKGLRAENWQGNVGDVKEAVGGRYYIEVDMPGTEGEVDVYLYTTKDVALSLGKGQQITFSGIVDGLYPEMFEDWSVEVKDSTISDVSGASMPAEKSGEAPLPGRVLAFAEIIRNPDNAGWTDVQFDEYKTSIKGSRAENWQGAVVDVKESVGGSYYVEVDMPGTEDTTDVFLYVNKDLALSLGKGQPITFSGVVDGLYPELFEDWKVEIRDATIN